MLQYFKSILLKVSFDAQLFEKELRKAIKSLVNEELVELKKWCFEQFGLQYGEILRLNFRVA